MFEDFLVRAVFASIGVALAAAPLGCFVVWRRMAYFGDATAHAAILGVAFSLAFGMSIFFGTLLVALAMAFAVTSIDGRGYAMDTLLGVMAHSALAAGLLVASLLTGVRVDLDAYLFGEIFSVSKTDLGLIWLGSMAVLGLLYWRWNALLASTLNQDLAFATGINPKREKLILTLCLAVIVAVAIKIIGVLLIVAMLIIPAAAARAISASPERMVFVAAGIGVLSAVLGLLFAARFNTPSGPSIVCTAAIAFLLTNLTRTFLRPAE